MPGPEGILRRLQNAQQVLGFTGPFFQLRRELVGKSPPIAGQREPALGTICGAQSMEMPKGARQHTVGESLAFTPPIIPKLAKVSFGRCWRTATRFVRKQSGCAEQACLQGDGFESWFRRCQARTQFGEPQHRPDVMLVTEAAEESFP